MERWFAKYPYKSGEKDAISMIEKELTKAKCLAEESKDYSLHLKYAKEMLDDFFEAKQALLPIKSSLT